METMHQTFPYYIIMQAKLEKLYFIAMERIYNIIVEIACLTRPT